MKKQIFAALLLMISVVVNGQNMPTNGLMGWWPFNGDATDQSGNGNNGILECDATGSNPTLTTDRFGNANSAYQFGGVDNPNWIRIPNSNSLKITNSFAISFWFKQDNAHGEYVGDCSGNVVDNLSSFIMISKGSYCDCGDENGGMRITTSYASEANMQSLGFTNTQTKISENHCMANGSYTCYDFGEWVYCVISVQHDTLKMYINGTQYYAAKQQEIDFTKANTFDLVFGAMNNHPELHPFNGALDDIAFYNRELSDAEIRKIYNNYSGVGTANNEIHLDSVVVVNPCGLNKGKITFHPTPNDGNDYFYSLASLTNSAQTTPTFSLNPGTYRLFAMTDCGAWDTVIELICQCEIDVTQVKHDSICPGESGSIGSILTIKNYKYNSNSDGWTSSGSIPWSSEYYETNTAIAFGTAQTWAHDGKSMYNCNYDGSFDNTTSYLISPAINLQYDLNKTSFKFYYLSIGLSTQFVTGVNTVSLEYSTSASGPWYTLWTQDRQSVLDWTEVSISLAQLQNNGTYYFRFTRRGNGYIAAIDDVTITSDTRRNIPAEVTNAADGATVRIDKELEATGLCPITETTLWYVKPRSNWDTTVYALSQYNWNNHTYTESGDYKKTGMKNHYNCDSTATLHLEITLNTYGDTSVWACDSFTWRGVTYYASTNTPIDTIGPNSYGGDSIVRLHLTINHNEETPISVSRCIEFSYLSHTYTKDTKDTIHINTVHGCDSALLMDVHIYYPDTTEIIDSICETQTYIFNKQQLRAAGNFQVILKNIHNCDSIVNLHLSHIKRTQVDVEYVYDCQTMTYTIWGISDRPYHKWSSMPVDNSLSGHEYDDTLKVKAQTGYTYTFYSDYSAQQYCPNQIDANLPVIEPVKAKMSIQPKYLSFEQLTLTAHNKSKILDYCEWFVDGELQNNNNEHFSYTVRPEIDSVIVTLVVHNDECTDTISTIVPFIRSTIYVPNAFTPTLPTTDKRRFYVTGVGITDYEIYIYNRGGLELYHSTDMQESWDGSYRGTLCPNGAYAYIIRYKDRITPGNWQYKTGTVLLIR